MVGHVDLPRLKEGQNGGAFWSAYVPCPKDGLDWSDENYAECKHIFHKLIECPFPSVGEGVLPVSKMSISIFSLTVAHFHLIFGKHLISALVKNLGISHQEQLQNMRANCPDLKPPFLLCAVIEAIVKVVPYKTYQSYPE